MPEPRRDTARTGHHAREPSAAGRARVPWRACEKGADIHFVRIIEGVAPVYVFATVAVVLAFIGVVIFVPSSRPARRLERIIRAWRRRS